MTKCKLTNNNQCALTTRLQLGPDFPVLIKRKHSCLFCLQVRVLFSKGPFISIFASDPHIIIKAINQNLNSVLRDSNINGHDYMRNIIHLPVFLNSRGLSTAKRLCISTPANADQLNSDGRYRNSNMHIFMKCVKSTYILL